MKKKGLAVLISCALCLSLAACSTPGSKKASNEGTEEKKEKVFRYSMKADVTTLDPQKSNELQSATIGYHIGEGLTRSENGEVHEGIAEK